MTQRNLDRPSKPEDDTATDEANGKAIRGAEDIDGKDHDPKPKDGEDRTTGHKSGE